MGGEEGWWDHPCWVLLFVALIKFILYLEVWSHFLVQKIGKPWRNKKGCIYLLWWWDEVSSSIQDIMKICLWRAEPCSGTKTSHLNIPRLNSSWTSNIGPAGSILTSHWKVSGLSLPLAHFHQVSVSLTVAISPVVKGPAWWHYMWWQWWNRVSISTHNIVKIHIRTVKPCSGKKFHPCQHMYCQQARAFYYKANTIIRLTDT